MDDTVNTVQVQVVDETEPLESELDAGGNVNNNRLSVKEISAFFGQSRNRTGSVDEGEESGSARVASARYDPNASDGREWGVKEISAKFQGTSKVETKQQYEQRRQVYQKILLSSNYAKTGFKKIASPQKQKMMRRWTAVVRSENLGISIDAESAKEFLAQHGVTSDNVDASDWTEWLEAIDFATNNPSSDMSASFYTKSESAATNLDLDLEIVQMEEQDLGEDEEDASRTHSPFTPPTNTGSNKQGATANPMNSSSSDITTKAETKKAPSDTTHNPLAPPLTPMHPDSQPQSDADTQPAKESSKAIVNTTNSEQKKASPVASKPATQAPLQTTTSTDTEDSTHGSGIFSCCFKKK